jgi:RNase adaptor protein for sRNA GlmZ degradation
MIDKSRLKLITLSAGIKAGPLPYADLIIDCRIIPDPSHVGGTGDDSKIQEWVRIRCLEKLSLIFQVVEAGIRMLDARRGGNEEKMYGQPFTILFFCAHGIHRSRSTKHIISDWLEDEGWKVEVK